MPVKVRDSHPSKLLEKLRSRVKEKAPAALAEAAVILEAEIKQLLLTPGRGRIRQGGREQLGTGSFNRGKDGKLHRVTRGAPRTKIDLTNRASAPGEPPAPDTGQLRNSIHFEFVDENKVRVGTHLKYAEALEFGTTTAGKSHNVVILPRPFMRPGLAAARARMKAGIVAELRSGAGDVVAELRLPK
jgi:hypothetical protein